MSKASTLEDVRVYPSSETRPGRFPPHEPNRGGIQFPTRCPKHPHNPISLLGDSTPVDFLPLNPNVAEYNSLPVI